MAKYRGNINPECLHCNQLIGRVIDEITSSCGGSVGETDGCCWEKRYDIQFPSNPCEFSKNYETILSKISQQDKKESEYSRETWDKCIGSKSRSTKHCVETGDCAEEPPGPKNHEKMYDCKNDNLLNKINPPRGELLDCINHFKTGNCCNPTKSSPKGLKTLEKQQWWDTYVRTNGGKQEES